MEFSKDFFFRRIVVGFLLQFLLLGSFAQGSIKGLITDEKTEEPLIGTTVMVQGTNLGVATNIDGVYELPKVNAGSYTLVIKSMSYSEKKLSNVVVKNKEVTELNIKLEEAGFQLKDVTIAGRRRTDTDLSMLSSIKLSNQVVNGISSQQIGKTLDKDASEVVKRVPGVTIQDNRFVVVRGLNQRYNNVWLNNAATPSSETDVKAFSFDAIPSSMIDNMMIYKTGAPELSAEATGGFIKIFTKNIPDQNFFQIEYTAQYNNQSTFKDTYRLDGGKTDFLGYDDGTRAISSSIPSSLNAVSTADRDKYALQINNSWLTKKHTALPNQKLGINFGKKWKLGGKSQLGNITAITYNNTYTTRTNMQNYQYESFDASTETPVYLSRYHTNVYTDEFKVGLLHNWTYQINNSNRIELKNLLNQIGVDKSSEVYGYNNYRQGNFKYFNNQYSSRTTYSGQLTGNHNLWQKDETKLDWILGFAYANRKEPNGERWSMKENAETGVYEYVLPTGASINELGRLYLENHEYINTVAANLSHQFEFFTIKPTLKTGFYGEYKTRHFKERSLCYKLNSYTSLTDSAINALSFDELFTSEYLGKGKVLTLDEQTDKKDSYDAENKLGAAYLALNIPVNKFNVYGGVRAEHNTLIVDGYYNEQTPVHINNPVLSLCPSVNATYNFTKKTLVRLAYAKTINRPEFREVSPLSYYDFTERYSVKGNPELKDAQIQNVDLRYEYYPTQAETFTFALFYKHFTNPIEMVSIGSSDFSFANAESAVNYGAELEIKKSLDNIIGLENFSITANASYIYSLVKFENQQTEKNRPLQGQSPFVVNTGLFYQQDKSGISTSLTYNVMGKRILVAAEVNQGSVVVPDIYEMPRHVIDFVFNKKFGKRWEVKFGVKDILAQDYVTQQTYDYVKDGVAKTVTLTNKKYNLGRTWSLGIVCKL